MDTSWNQRARAADALIAEGRAQLVEVIVEADEAGLSQRAIANVVNRSQPEVARHLANARRTFATVPQLARSMREHLDAGREHQALRIMLDGVNVIDSLSSSSDTRAFLARPPSLGDHRWDALLAATVAFRARRAGLEPPRWTAVEPLESFWWPAGEWATRAQTMTRTPIDFKRLGIWFDELNFATA